MAIKVMRKTGYAGRVYAALQRANDWATEHPATAGLIVGASIAGLATLLIPDVQHALVGLVNNLFPPVPEWAQTHDGCVKHYTAQYIHENPNGQNAVYFASSMCPGPIPRF